MVRLFLSMVSFAVGAALAQSSRASFTADLACVDEDQALEIASTSYEGAVTFALHGATEYDVRYESSTLSAPTSRITIEIDYRKIGTDGWAVCHALRSTDDPGLNHELCVDVDPLFRDRMLSWVHDVYTLRSAFRSRCLLTWTD